MIQSCSWCHELNDTTMFQFCATCGHRADRSRAECDCGQCVAWFRSQPLSPDVGTCDICGGDCGEGHALAF